MPGRPLPAASRPPAATRLLAGLLALALALVVGCTDRSTDAQDDPAPPGPAPVGAAATTTRGAELRAALTWLLTTRVHLVLAHARALQDAEGRRDEPPVVAARRALEASTEATVKTLGGSYSGAAAQLLPALRAHDSALLAHTSALVAGDQAAAAHALDDVDAQRAELARAVRRVVPRLRAQDVEATLSAGTAATLEAVQAVAERSTHGPALQRGADEAAWSTARLLAVGVSTDRGLGLAGSAATDLRGRLTGLLTEHVLLSGELAARLRAADGHPDDPHVRATEAALDATAVALSELAGRTAPGTALPVLSSWREHLRELRELAGARAVRSVPPPPPRDYLDRLREALAPHAEALPPRAGEIGAQSAAALRAAVDDAATGSAQAPESLRAAAAQTVAPAALLAAALAEQLQLS